MRQHQRYIMPKRHRNTTSSSHAVIRTVLRLWTVSLPSWIPAADRRKHTVRKRFCCLAIDSPSKRCAASTTITTTITHQTKVRQLLVDNVLVAQLAAQSRPHRVQVCVVAQHKRARFGASNVEDPNAIKRVHLCRTPDHLGLCLVRKAQLYPCIKNKQTHTPQLISQLRYIL